MSSLPGNNPVAKDWCHTNLKIRTFIYEWAIHNFTLRAEANGIYVESSQFPANEVPKWSIRAYPRGAYTSTNTSLEIYIVSHSQSQVNAKCEISILNVNREKFNTFVTQTCPFAPGQPIYIKEFIKRNILLNTANALLPKNTLTLLCEISVVNETGNISGQSNIVQFKVPEKTLIDDFGSLFANEKFSDIKLIASGKELKAHKAILAARSQVFAAMFEHEMEEQNSNRVTITDVDHDVLKELLRYIYTDKAPKLDVMAEDLLAAADKYAVENLKVMCEESLRANISIEKAAITLALAERHNAEQLKSETIKFIIRNAAGVMKTQGWIDMRTACSPLIEEVFCKIAQQLTIN